MIAETGQKDMQKSGDSSLAVEDSVNTEVEMITQAPSPLPVSDKSSDVILPLGEPDGTKDSYMIVEDVNGKKFYDSRSHGFRDTLLVTVFINGIEFSVTKIHIPHKSCQDTIQEDPHNADSHYNFIQHD